jgi:hypothetical protein
MAHTHNDMAGLYWRPTRRKRRDLDDQTCLDFPPLPSSGAIPGERPLQTFTIYGRADVTFKRNRNFKLLSYTTYDCFHRA